MSPEKLKFATVDEYIASFPGEVQEDLRAVRDAIKSAIPDAEEVISYQMPTVKFHGVVLYNAAFKKHYSLFVPDTGKMFEALGQELAPYEVVRSTVKLRRGQPIPVGLIGAIARFRAAENLDRAPKSS